MLSCLRIFVFIAGLVFISLTAIAEDKESELFINHSNVQSLKLWVQSGEKLEIFNSHICDNTTTACIIFLDRNATMSAASSTLGSALTIYHTDSSLDAIEMRHTKLNAKIIEGAPPFAAQLVMPAGARSARRKKDLNHTELNNFSGRVSTDQHLETFNSKICIDPAGDVCRLLIEPGAKASFLSTKLGTRVEITSTIPLATGLSFRHTNYPYPVGSKSKESVVVDQHQEDRKIVEQLKEKSVNAVTSDRGVVIALPDVFFEFDKATLTQDAQSNIDEIAKVLKGVQDRLVSIEGHTDALGTAQYNQQLSEERANAVLSALTRRRMPSARLEARGFGKSRPVSDNDSDEGRARNRRVEIVLEHRNTQHSQGAVSATDQATRNLNRTSSVKKSSISTDEEVHIKSADSAVHIDDRGVFIQDSSGTVRIGDDGVHIDAKE